MSNNLQACTSTEPLFRSEPVGLSQGPQFYYYYVRIISLLVTFAHTCMPRLLEVHAF